MKEINLVTMSHGGGVQTSTIGEMIVEGEIEKPHAVIFADTGDEPSYVYAQVEYMRKRLALINVPLIVVSNGNLHDDVYGGKRFAAMPLFTRNRSGRRGKKQKSVNGQMMAFDLSEFEEDVPETISGFGLESQIETKGKMRRQCTSEYKITPIDREIRIMLLEMGLARQSVDKNGVERIYINKDVMVETWIGYTVDEVERIKPPRQKWQRFRYPLIERRLTYGNCIQWLLDHGLPIPKSSSCRKCPIINDRRIMELKQHDPSGYKSRVKFDRDLRNGRLRIAATVKGELYVHRDCIPLDEVKLDPNRPLPLECVGHCMT